MVTGNWIVRVVVIGYQRPHEANNGAKLNH